jgi:hypothetical protein
MNWKALIHTPAGRRAIFAGVNLLALFALYLIFVEPARRMIANGAEIVAEKRQTLARYEAVASHEEQIQDYARQIAETNGRGELFDGDSEGVINANLQARLKSVAEQANVTVRSIQILPQKQFRGVSLVGARLDVSGSYDNLHALARALEGDPPLLIVTAATLRGQGMIWGAQPQTDQDMEAQFDVFGGAPRKGRS